MFKVGRKFKVIDNIYLPLNLLGKEGKIWFKRAEEIFVVIDGSVYCANKYDIKILGNQDD